MQNQPTLKSKAYAIIKGKIITCALKPGNPISEKDLMAEIGVGRTPIREALGQLESEKLVRIFPKRGIFVSEITEKEIVDIYLIRGNIEPLAVRLATPLISESLDLDRFQKIYSPEDYHPSFQEHLQNDRELHLCIANRSHNEHLERFITMAYDINSRIRHCHIALFTEERMRQSRLEHLELLYYMRERDCEKAGEAMRKHISVGMHGALKMFDVRTSADFAV
ncbi:MAG: GntR family transcriptional regulator [Planctomycetota bacterium]|nr:GntR family transcriptional regulator [Planctomycetota bacterium]